MNQHNRSPKDYRPAANQGDYSSRRKIPQYTRQIRILNGPMRDAAYDLVGRTLIGREEGADILLLHTGVSRRHACVICDNSGQHILLDLGSTNGTLIDNKKIKRVPLSPGATFEVAGCRMVYEEVPLACSNAPRVEPVVPGVQGLNRIDPGSRSGPEPTDQEPPYEGDLIADIARYRTLRTRRFRDTDTSDVERAMFDRLEERMRPAESGRERRSYNRFRCEIRCTVRTTSRREIEGTLVDMGVDGAKIVVADRELQADSLVWIALPRRHSGHVRTLVFSARIAWSGSSSIGVAFSGAPGWSQAMRRMTEKTTKAPIIADLVAPSATRASRSVARS